MCVPECLNVDTRLRVRELRLHVCSFVHDVLQLFQVIVQLAHHVFRGWQRSIITTRLGHYHEYVRLCTRVYYVDCARCVPTWYCASSNACARCLRINCYCAFTPITHSSFLSSPPPDAMLSKVCTHVSVNSRRRMHRAHTATQSDPIRHNLPTFTRAAAFRLVGGSGVNTPRAHTRFLLAQRVLRVPRACSVQSVFRAHTIQQITAPGIMGKNRRGRRAREITDAMEAVAKVCALNAGCNKPGCATCVANLGRRLKTADGKWRDCEEVFDYVKRAQPHETWGILRHARMMVLEDEMDLFRYLCAAVAANKRQFLRHIASLALDCKKEDMARIAIRFMPAPRTARAGRASTDELAMRCMKSNFMRAFDDVVSLYAGSELMHTSIITKAFVAATENPHLYEPLLWIIASYGGHVSVGLHLKCYRRLCALDDTPAKDMILYTRLLAQDSRFRDHCEFIHTVVRDASVECVQTFMSFGTITVATQLMAVHCVKRSDPECQAKLEAIVTFQKLAHDPNGPIPAEVHDAIVRDDAMMLEARIPACETFCPELALAVSHVISLCVMKPSPACLRLLKKRVGSQGILSMMMMTSVVPLIDLGLLNQLRVITDIAPELASKPNSVGRLPLHAACASKFLHAHDMVDILLRSGADPNARECHGDAALHIAATVSDEDMLLMLVQHGADVGAQDSKGATPLHYAVQSLNRPVVETLLSLGAPTHLLARIADGEAWTAEALAHHKVETLSERLEECNCGSQTQYKQCRTAEKIWFAIASHAMAATKQQTALIVPNLRSPFSTCGRLVRAKHRASGATR